MARACHRLPQQSLHFGCLSDDGVELSHLLFGQALPVAKQGFALRHGSQKFGDFGEGEAGRPGEPQSAEAEFRFEGIPSLATFRTARPEQAARLVESNSRSCEARAFGELSDRQFLKILCVHLDFKFT